MGPDPPPHGCRWHLVPRNLRIRVRDGESTTAGELCDRTHVRALIDRELDRATAFPGAHTIVPPAFVRPPAPPPAEVRGRRNGKGGGRA